MSLIINVISWILFGIFGICAFGLFSDNKWVWATVCCFLAVLSPFAADAIILNFVNDSSNYEEVVEDEEYGTIDADEEWEPNPDEYPELYEHDDNTSSSSSSSYDSYPSSSYPTSNYGGSQQSTTDNSYNENYYRSTYNRYEQLVQSHYNSLTTLYGSDAEPYEITHMKGLINEAQRDLRRVRNEAAQNGVQIYESQWETMTVY